MGPKKRIRRGAAVWRQLFSRQSSCGLSVPEFCRREGINASLFRRWRSTLEGSEADRRVTTATAAAVESPVPFASRVPCRFFPKSADVTLNAGGVR